MKLAIVILLVINTYSASASMKEMDKFFKVLKQVDQEDNFDSSGDASVDDKCADEAGKEKYCYNEAFKGKCETNKDEMKKKCKRSCGYCCADEKTFKHCNWFKQAKYCVTGKYKKSARILCPDTCGLCNRAFTQIPCATSIFGCCWDGSIAKNTPGSPDDGCPECQNLNSQVFCNNFKADCDSKFTPGEQLYNFCPATCGYCGDNRVCRDKPDVKEDICIRMRNEGQCESNEKYMRFKCEKTCGFCSPCQDKPGVQCARNKQYNACVSHKDRMAELCPRTCGFCPK